MLDDDLRCISGHFVLLTSRLQPRRPSLHLYLCFLGEDVDVISERSPAPSPVYTDASSWNATAQPACVSESISSAKHKPWICTFVRLAWVWAHVWASVDLQSAIFISFKSSLTLSCRGNAVENGGWLAGEMFTDTRTRACFCTRLFQTLMFPEGVSLWDTASIFICL